MCDKKEYRFNGRIIEGVTIDFWATLAHDTTYEKRKQLRRERVHSWLTDHGYIRDFKTVVLAMDEFSKKWMHMWLDKQQTPSAYDAVNFLAEEFNLDLNEKDKVELSEIIDDAMVDAPPVPIKGSKEALIELSKVFPLALICDTGLSGAKNVNRLIDKWGLNDLLKVRVFSEEQGVSKPNPKMFLTALDAIKVTRNRAVHIGDMDPTDIKGAKELGMAAIRFDGGKDKSKCAACSMADLVTDSWQTIVNSLLKSE